MIVQYKKEDFDPHDKRMVNKVRSVDERDFRKFTDTKRTSEPLINFGEATVDANDSVNLSTDAHENGADPQRTTAELKNLETKIVEYKGKIEAAVYQLSGVETLLAFVSDDKLGDLILEKEKQNDNISELNFELNVLEDQKSSLLASYGNIEDVKNRVAELEKQIEMYLDNCDKLRRMQDVSVIEDLPEIRDNIEFCENMVDTLQDELNGLREKLGEFDQPDCSPSDPQKELSKKRRNQKKVNHCPMVLYPGE